MKKFIYFSVIVTSLIASPIPKDNSFFVSADVGQLKVRDYSLIAGIKFGYYFYDPNRFKINNRIYVDLKKVDSSASFYISSLNLDWIKNTSKINPYIGLNVGYLYFKQNGIDSSSQIWGINAGGIIYFSKTLGIELLYKWQKSIDKQEMWDRALQTIEGSLEVSF